MTTFERAVLIAAVVAITAVLAGIGLVVTLIPNTAGTTAAALAFGGVFSAALLSLVGVLLKNSLDRRAEARLEAEAIRNTLMAEDNARRFQLDAAIRAVQLLSTSSGILAPPVQRAGVLYTLSTLGYHELTLSLIGDLLTRGEVDATTASSTISRALENGDETVQRLAVMLLYDHAPKFLTSSAFSYPMCLLRPSQTLTPYVRGWVPALLVKLLMARSLPDWQQRLNSLITIIGALIELWQRENDVMLRSEVGAILDVVLPLVQHLGTVTHLGSVVVLSDIRDDLTAPRQWRPSVHTEQLVASLSKWLRQEE